MGSGGGGGTTMVSEGGMPGWAESFVQNQFLPYLQGSMMLNPPMSQEKYLNGVQYPKMDSKSGKTLKKDSSTGSQTSTDALAAKAASGGSNPFAPTAPPMTGQYSIPQAPGSGKIVGKG